MSASTALGHRKKLSPIHPGEILHAEFLAPMTIPPSRLARAIGVDVRWVRAIVHGQRSITAKTALLFSRFFGNTGEFRMGLQSQYDLEKERDRLGDRLDCVAAYDGASTARSCRAATRSWQDALAARCRALAKARTRVSCRQESVMDMRCTAVFRKVPDGYIAFIEEFPGANTQGASLEEARTSLREAVTLVVEANRSSAREDAAAGTTILLNS